MEKFKKILLEICSYGLIIFIVLFIKFYVVSPIRVNGSSMYNPLPDGDIMILNEFLYRFKEIARFDIVVVEEEGELLIKRVIGMPGEVIECKNNIIYINEKRLKDKYAYSETSDFSKIELGNDEYFVLGDNRSVSIDSRKYGAYKSKNIKGKANFIIYPFSRFGSKD